MKKITKLAANAFIYGNNFKQANTEVKVLDNGDTELYLHSNKIAVYNANSGQLSISNAGWQSNTTKERLNGLLGVSISQKKHVWYLNGQQWNGEWITINKN